MGIDIRLPIGALFTLLGGILTAYGALGGHEQYARTSGWNINLWWGLALLAFGVAFLLAGRRAKSRDTRG